MFKVAVKRPGRPIYTWLGIHFIVLAGSVLRGHVAVLGGRGLWRTKSGRVHRIRDHRYVGTINTRPEMIILYDTNYWSNSYKAYICIDSSQDLVRTFR